MKWHFSVKYTADSPFEGGCSLVASFRPGFGSAVVLGSDKNDVIGSACQKKQWPLTHWQALAEHVGTSRLSYLYFLLCGGA